MLIGAQRVELSAHSRCMFKVDDKHMRMKNAEDQQQNKMRSRFYSPLLCTQSVKAQELGNCSRAMLIEHPPTLSAPIARHCLRLTAFHRHRDIQCTHMTRQAPQLVGTVVREGNTMSCGATVGPHRPWALRLVASVPVRLRCIPRAQSPPSFWLHSCGAA